MNAQSRFPAFSERIARRHRLWWGRPGWGRRSYRDALHRLRERRQRRTRHDPDGLWRCCADWPRTLLDKGNGREFAARHGCRIPELYWRGPASGGVPYESLPDRFVIRPVHGAGNRGVFVVVGGRDLLRDEPAAPAEIRARLPWLRRIGLGQPILVEEFIGSEDGGDCLPLECKAHTFGDAVAAVQVIERPVGGGAKHRFYTPAWEPFADPINVGLPEADVRGAPPHLEAMLDLAMTLGREIGTYMRIDFFATAHGPVFNEFSSTPRGGLKGDITPYGERLFGEMWAARFPDAT